MTTTETTTATESAFTYENHLYSTTSKGYHYRDRKRISKKVYEQARYDHMQEINHGMVIHETHNTVKPEINHPTIETIDQEENDMNITDNTSAITAAVAIDEATTEEPTTKTTKKRTYKPQSVAFEYDGITITQRQYDFLKEVQMCNSWKGVSIIVKDMNREISGEFAGSPFVTGAILSTLKEKGLATIEVEALELKGGQIKKLKNFILTTKGWDMLDAINESERG